ncbi:hypothetical protein EAF64_03790 [Halorientalis pallida]|uniref:Uncharacterized protein n=1 Tax=Halorientalis pallida TaxID=2479928 RepID=A0A498L1B1_9EURY|nr:hypothetical protein EAF64_03790 [Halorientalis pallida]
MSRASAEAHGWDVDGDGTVDRRGRALELSAKPSGETAVTLSIESANGTTTSVTRVVPATLILANETATPDEAGTPPTDTGGGVPAVALVALLLVVLVAVLAARSRMDR